ncbi:polysaccharide deacetylase family protein [Streptomyces sp. NPDC059578]|uniref:polysaccharide deacetylase family protein n=1 Tax=Streptomyces sp. NPDC059578 TaxID=3346874 RepID=UPI0036CD3442
MRLVRQNEQNTKPDPRGDGERDGRVGRAGRGSARPGALTRSLVTALALTVATTALAGCGAEAEPTKPAASGRAGGAPGERAEQGEQAKQAKGAKEAKEAAEAAAARKRTIAAARLATAKRWGLAKAPLTAPPPPAVKPKITTRAGFEVEGHEDLPPVFTTIPTKDKVVFLTIDDGADKDPALIKMLEELDVPYTAFLSDYLVKEDYGYFRKMRDAGVTLNNHSLTHPYLPGLSYAQQKHQICGMQDVLQKQYGTRPTVFRPPYGNYNEDTLRAAKACGIAQVPLWNEEVFVDRWEYREYDKSLRPGDIVLTHFRGRKDWDGTMPDTIRRFLGLITDQGYAVAKLEDYL